MRAPSVQIAAWPLTWPRPTNSSVYGLLFFSPASPFLAQSAWRLPKGRSRTSTVYTYCFICSFCNLELRNGSILTGRTTVRFTVCLAQPRQPSVISQPGCQDFSSDLANSHASSGLDSSLRLSHAAFPPVLREWNAAQIRCSRECTTLGAGCTTWVLRHTRRSPCPARRCDAGGGLDGHGDGDTDHVSIDSCTGCDAPASPTR